MLKEVKDDINLSIITVVYNRKEEFESTIKNIIALEYQSFEIIVIQTGSNDGTVDVIKKYQKHINYWISEPDKGIYDAMNKGIKVAKGKWLSFMNAGDEYCSKNIISDIFKTNSDFNNIDLLIGNTIIKYEDFQRTLHVGNTDQIWKGAQFIHQSVLIKRSFQKSHLYNIENKISADFEFFFKSFKSRTNFKILPQVISVFRAGGISDTKRLSAVFSNMMVVFLNDTLSIKIILFYVLILIKMLITLIIKSILPNKLIKYIQYKLYENS